MCLRDEFIRDAERDTRDIVQSRNWDALPLEAVVQEFVRTVVRQHRRHRGTLRALVGRTIAGAGAGCPSAELEAPPSTRLLGHLIGRRSEIGHPDPDVAVHLGLAMVTGAVRERVLFPELSASARPAAPVTDAVLVEELSRALVAFLGVNTPERSE